jgi:hypothetical protein
MRVLIVNQNPHGVQEHLARLFYSRHYRPCKQYIQWFKCKDFRFQFTFMASSTKWSNMYIPLRKQIEIIPVIADVLTYLNNDNLKIQEEWNQHFSLYQKTAKSAIYWVGNPIAYRLDLQGENKNNDIRKEVKSMHHVEGYDLTFHKI